MVRVVWCLDFCFMVFLIVYLKMKRVVMEISSVGIEIASQTCCRTEMHGRLCNPLFPVIPIPMIRMVFVRNVGHLSISKEDLHMLTVGRITHSDKHIIRFQSGMACA